MHTVSLSLSFPYYFFPVTLHFATQNMSVSSVLSLQLQEAILPTLFFSHLLPTATSPSARGKKNPGKKKIPKANQAGWNLKVLCKRTSQATLLRQDRAENREQQMNICSSRRNKSSSFFFPYFSGRKLISFLFPPWNWGWFWASVCFHREGLCPSAHVQHVPRHHFCQHLCPGHHISPNWAETCPLLLPWGGFQADQTERIKHTSASTEVLGGKMRS